MHRGGTSALAGVAAHLGLVPPRTLIPASSDNPLGFYESQPIVAANHQILLAAGCAWNLCLHFDLEAVQPALGADARRLMLHLLRAEFGDQGSFVLKDPRLCVMLPLWRPMLQAVASEHVLIVIRHPAEVCRSIASRNNLPEAETAPLWLHHMLKAERLTRDLPRAFLSYDALLNDWQATITPAAEAARIVWPEPAERAAEAIRSFVAPMVRHHRAGTASAAIGPEATRHLTNQAWLALNQLVRAPDDAAAMDCLDDVHAAFSGWCRTAYPRGRRVVFQSPPNAPTASPVPADSP
ncbi:MAG: hypothetical protein JSS43_15260 [Proteobacteria bacterium]|nr:hypothetical protein [Pseudomonadota bacterium]